MTSEQDRTGRPGNLAQRLAIAAEAIERIPADTAAIAQLAQAWNGFYVARTVAVLLDAEAVSHRDAYALAEGWCTEALEVLYDVAGRDQVRIYSPDHATGNLQELATQGQAELSLSSDTDIERIAGAMVHLAAALQDLLNRIAEDQTALPEYRSAAQLALPAARNIWSHYGGDSGGW